MEQQLFKVKDVAKILGVSFPFLDRKVRAGEIKVTMMGTKRLITVAEIDRLKEEGLK